MEAGRERGSFQISGGDGDRSEATFVVAEDGKESMFVGANAKRRLASCRKTTQQGALAANLKAKEVENYSMNVPADRTALESSIYTTYTVCKSCQHASMLPGFKSLLAEGFRTFAPH